MKKVLIVLGAVLLPSITFAAGGIDTAVRNIGNIIDMLVPILMTLALVGFFYGLAMYIFKADEDKDKGRSIMIYGILALFVMVSIWGIVAVLGQTLGVQESKNAPTITIPTVR